MRLTRCHIHFFFFDRLVKRNFSKQKFFKNTFSSSIFQSMLQNFLITQKTHIKLIRELQLKCCFFVLCQIHIIKMYAFFIFKKVELSSLTH